jgi:autoinducer 2 (AI-2) kinase
MASTGERLVSWSREHAKPAHRELYRRHDEKWQAVYADQLGLVDSGLTTSMWQAPGWCAPLTGPHGTVPDFLFPSRRGPVTVL